MTEFCSIRGALSSIYDPAFNFGIIVSFILGKYLNCMDQVKVQIIIPIIFMVIMFLLPETPEFWTKQNKDKVSRNISFNRMYKIVTLLCALLNLHLIIFQRAIKSRTFYRGKITDLENGEFLTKSPKNLTKQENIVENASAFGRFCSIFEGFGSPQAKKAFIISLSSLILSFFCCTLVIIVYVTDIFSKTGSALSENNSSLLISVTTLIGNLVFLSIVERFNRKVMHIT